MHTAPEEFQQFVKAYAPDLLRSAYLVTGEQFLAERLVREALAMTLREWRRVPRRGGPEACAARTMYRLLVSPWGRRWTREDPPGYGLDRPLPGVPHDPRAAAVKASVRMALSAVTVRQRVLVVLRHLDERDDAESAAILGTSARRVARERTSAAERIHRLVPELDEATDRLAAIMSSIADEAVPTDLVGSSVARARRLGRQRAVAAGSVSVLVLGVLGCATWVSAPWAQ